IATGHPILVVVFILCNCFSVNFLLGKQKHISFGATWWPNIAGAFFISGITIVVFGAGRKGYGDKEQPYGFLNHCFHGVYYLVIIVIISERWLLVCNTSMAKAKVGARSAPVLPPKGGF